MAANTSKSTQSNKGVGDNSVSMNLGDHNNVVIGGNINSFSPSPSEIFDLLTIFEDSQLELEDGKNGKNPADLNAKLTFNGANVARALFEDFGDTWQLIDQTLSEQFTDSEIIDRKLKRMFLQNDRYMSHMSQNPDERFNEGDAVLKEMQFQILELLQSDNRLSEMDIRQEKLEEFAIGLLMRGVSLCKVLVNPNDIN